MDNLKDGYSYSEKIMYCLLCELDCDFTKEKSDFKWLKPWNKRYDFYFEKDGQDYIIETHGGQHYTNKGFSSLGGRTLEEEQENTSRGKRSLLNLYDEASFLSEEWKDLKYDEEEKDMQQDKTKELENEIKEVKPLNIEEYSDELAKAKEEKFKNKLKEDIIKEK